MSKEMVISSTPHETRVAIMEEGQLCEIYVEREKEFALVGSIYKGRVTRVLPGMQSSFVDIGLDSDAFLYVSDFLEEIDDLDHVVTTVEDKVQKIEDQGGKVFATDAEGHTATVEPGDVEPVASASASASFSSAGSGEARAFVAPPEAEEDAQPPLITLPGEVRAEPGAVAPRPFQSGGGRPSGFGGNRGRDNRGGGFGGGGRGRRGGRPDNRRGGSSGGSGGGGGRRDNRRFGGGRDLPSSKYASHRPHDPLPETEGGGAPAGDFVPVILPGESLSRFKDAPLGAAPPVTSPGAGGDTNAAAIQEVAHESGAVSESPAPMYETEHRSEHHSEPKFERHESRHTANRGELRGEHRETPRWKEQQPPASGGLAPLPGETLQGLSGGLSGAQSSEFAGLPEAEAAHTIDFDRHATKAIEETAAAAATATHREEIAHAEPEPAAHDTHGLSAEEAASVFEQVAEAQREETEREATETALRENGEHEEHDGAFGHEDHGAIAAGEHESFASHEHEPAFAAGGAEATDADVDAELHEHDVVSLTGEESDEEAAVEAEENEGGIPSDTSPVLEGETAINAAQAQPSSARVRGDFRARFQNRAPRRGPGGGGGGGNRDRGRRDDRGGGRRPQHGHGGARPAPRRMPLISDLLKQGQEIIVQIAKEPLGKKGARITSHVALPGRFLVYMPTLDHTGVSRKIASAEERARLRHLVTDAKGASGGGFIVRTAASQAAPEEVRADVEFLTRTWAEIKSRADQRKAPSLLHRDLNLVERILRDYLSSDYTAIWVDSEEEYTKVVDFVSRFQPSLVNRVKLYTKETPVYEEFGIQQEIDKGLRPKVWLKSGGYIVINHTEALVAIDVNTGKFVGKGSNRLEDTIVRTNLEAVKEIVRQMRLRDLGGIIVIDFIDMEERRNREKVAAALDEALKADRAPSKVLRFNEFGLINITRKRTKQALERTLCQPCPYCTGSGMVKSIPTLCYEIQAEARKMAPEIEAASLTLRVHPEIAKALKTRESSLMDELESWVKKSIIIQADPTLHWEQYDIY
jgi:ribonuclease G